MRVDNVREFVHNKLVELLEVTDILNTIDEDEVLEIENGVNFLKIVSMFTSQKKAPWIEKYLISKLKAEKVKSSLGKGDFLYEGTYYELKTTFSTDSVNMRQVRLWQNVDYMIFVVDEQDPKNSILFKLTHDELVAEFNALGVSYMHGVESVNKSSEFTELSFTLKRNSEHFNRWIKEYRTSDLENIILGKKESLETIEDIEVSEPVCVSELIR